MSCVVSFDGARGRGRFLLRFVLAEIELVSRGVRGYEEGMLTLCPTNNCNLSFRVHQPISRPRFESLTERDFFDELIYLCPPPTPSSPRRERRILATHEFTRLPHPPCTRPGYRYSGGNILAGYLLMLNFNRPTLYLR